MAFSLLFWFQLPTRKNARESVAFILEDDPQMSAAICATIQNMDFIKSLVFTRKIVVEKTFFSFFKFDTMFA